MWFTNALFSLVNLGMNAVNLGINTVNAVNTYSIRKDIHNLTLGNLSAERQSQLIDEMRNIIFTGMQVLNKVEKQLSNNPQQACIAAYLVSWRINEDLQLTPRVFSDFTDKEKLVELTEKAESIQSSSLEKLTEDQKQQFSECKVAIAELPLLNQTIQMRENKEKLNAVNARWGKGVSRNTTGKIIGLVMMVVSANFVCGVSFSNPRPSDFLVFLSVLLGIAGFIIFLVSKPSDLDKLKQDKEVLENQIPEPSIQSILEERYKGIDNTKLQSKKNNLEEMIVKMIGDRGKFEELIS